MGKPLNNVNHHFCWSCFHLLLLLLLLVHHPQIALSGNQVKYLPGLELPDGTKDLPFYLETGYIGVGESMDVEFFYYFVESEKNPSQDPLLLWLTGGPRCSTLSAFAFEIGPINFVADGEYNGSLPTLSLNPNSWTKIANIIFVDAPVDTGFSYSKSSDTKVVGDKESANTTYEFLIKWLIKHPQFQSNPLYIGGDSYAGVILPMVVQQLVRDIDVRKYPFLNFKGYLLGNPKSNDQLEANSIIPYAHGMGLISNELYQSLRQNCKEEYFNVDKRNVNCLKDLQVFKLCTSGIKKAHILDKTCSHYSPRRGRDLYRRSLTRMKDDFILLPPVFPGCRSYGYMLSAYWANDDRVRKALHIKNGTVKNWIRCKRYLLPYRIDVKNTIEYHRNLSTKGYRSLIYSGDHDMLITRISTEEWIRLLGLPIVDDWRPWLVDGQVGGYTRSYSGGMTYATVKGGGHTAPEYRPEECFAMFERWISNSPL